MPSSSIFLINEASLYREGPWLNRSTACISRRCSSSPCFKGGKSYFYDVYKNYPEKYWKSAEMEEKTGYTVFKECSLRELGERFRNSKEWEESQLTLQDFIPCDCWN